MSCCLTCAGGRAGGAGGGAGPGDCEKFSQHSAVPGGFEANRDHKPGVGLDGLRPGLRPSVQLFGRGDWGCRCGTRFRYMLAIDLAGHAYFYDFGNNKVAYVEAAMKAIDWSRVGRRLAAAQGGRGKAAAG